MKRLAMTAMLAVTTHLAHAQKPLPTMYLGAEILIPALQINQAGNGGTSGELFVGADGRIIVFPRTYYGDIRYFDSLGKTLPMKLPMGDRDGELGWWERAGWMGTTFWVGDGRYKQAVLTDGSAKIVKTIPYPSWVHPHWADRRKYPLFARFFPLALYPDSTMLVRPQSARTLLDTPGFNKKQLHLMRIDRDGAIMKDVVAYDDDLHQLVLQGLGRSEHVMNVPFMSRTLMQVTGDGKRIVFVTPGRTAADSGTFRVMSLNENGDTVFNKTFAMPAVRVSKKTVDSTLAQVHGFNDTPAEQIRERLAKRIPDFQSYVTNLFVGTDHSTWIIQRPVSDTATARTAFVLDERGEPLANVVMPVNIVPHVVDRSHMWGIDRQRQSVVRMKLQATPPPVVPPAAVDAKKPPPKR